MRRFDEQSDREVLEVRPGADADEVFAAYDRLARMLSPDSLAVYSIAEKKDLEALHARLRQAFINLTGHPPEDHPSTLPGRLLRRLGRSRGEAAGGDESPAGRAAGPGPEALVAAISGASTSYTGLELRRRREEHRLTLQQVSARTRISVRQIEDIESEAFSRLPTQAHLRGFIVAYAGVLGLDGEEVWASYRERWQAAGFGKPAAVSLEPR